MEGITVTTFETYSFQSVKKTLNTDPPTSDAVRTKVEEISFVRGNHAI